MKKIFIIIFIIILSTTKLYSDERDVQLNRLFNELKIDNAALVYGTEQKIWEIWTTHPTDPNLTQKLLKGTKLMQGNTLAESIKIFSNLIDLDPSWAEAWNKRATAL